MKFARLTLMIVAVCASVSAFAAGRETVAQHAAAKNVKVGKFYRWNINERKATDPALKNKREIKMKHAAGQHSHLKARKMLVSEAHSHTAFKSHTQVLTLKTAPKGARK